MDYRICGLITLRLTANWYQSKLREKFISKALQADITAARWYDAIFNNERQSVESIAQACLGLVQSG